MTDQCQYLEYRPLSGAGGSEAGGDSDDAVGSANDAGAEEPRAYCTAADRFVQAMRADICNRRYGLAPETDCEFYREAEGLPEASPGEGASGAFDAGAGCGASGDDDAGGTSGARGHGDAGGDPE